MAVNTISAKVCGFLALVACALHTVGCHRHEDHAAVPLDVYSGPPGSGPAGHYRVARFPIFDVHTHLQADATARALALFDAHGTRMAINLSGGWPGRGLEETLAQSRESHGRILPFCNLPWPTEGAMPPTWVADAIHILDECHRLGVRGLKIQKVLGLRAVGPDGLRLRVDDPVLDPIFDHLAELGMPVLIHAGDPRAFFDPPTPENERFAELSVHPGWSFYGHGNPTWDEVLGEFEHLVLRHRRTVFIGAHFGNAAEDPARVASLLERAPNYYIDTAARIPEFGRHDPHQMHDFFERWQDRILYGTDLGVGPEEDNLMLGSTGAEPPTPDDVERFFSSSFRYFESWDRAFQNPTAIQGSWTIDGIGLSDDVLRKVYGGNLAHLLGVPWPPP